MMQFDAFWLFIYLEVWMWMSFGYPRLRMLPFTNVEENKYKHAWIIQKAALFNAICMISYFALCYNSHRKGSHRSYAN